MSWFARSLASSFRATDEEHDDEEDKEEEEDDEEESRRHGRGMKEDLSELTKSFTKQIWGVASFLAPPPATSTQDADPSLRDSPASVSNPDPYSSSEGNSQQVESLNRIENSSSGSLTENAQGLTGIRSDLAEIRGSVKTGLSKFSSNKAVHGISKLASTFFPFKGESEGEEFREAESGDFEEEEEESGAFEEEGESGAFEEEESFKSAVGITDEVLTFARNISMHPETWLDFPLFDDEDDTDDFNLSDIQKEHALAIERLAPRLAALRIELCPGYMSEGRFWKIYFVLLHSRLNKQDALLLSTPQIVEARGLLMQELQNRTKVQTRNSRSDMAYSEEKRTPFPPEEKFSNQSILSNKNVKTGSFKIVSLQSATSVAAKDFQRDDQLSAISSQKQIFNDQHCAPREDSLFQNKNVLSGTVKLSDLKYQEEEEEDDWLEEEPVGEDVPVCTTARLGDEEDVSFSDLEDEDDNMQTTTTGAKESFDSSSKGSKGWVQLNKDPNSVKECSMSNNSKGEDTIPRPMNTKSDAHILRSGEESTEQHIKKSDTGESSDWLTVDEDDVVSADSS